jgi:hypothetical protein
MLPAEAATAVVELPALVHAATADSKVRDAIGAALRQRQVAAGWVRGCLDYRPKMASGALAPSASRCDSIRSLKAGELPLVSAAI